MKIRIQGNTVRLRLSQDEVEAIGNLKSVQENTDFQSNRFIYEVKTHVSGPILQADFTNGRMVISMLESIAKHWANSDDVVVDTSRDSELFISVEKDFQCLTARPHEDESKLFPNPNLNC